MIRFVLPRSVRAAGAALWLPLAVAAVAGCHKNNNAAIVAAQTSGTLIVTVASPPNVKFPNVTVTGPTNFATTIAGTDTLIDLGAGKYTIAAGPVSSTDEVVSTVYTGVVTGSPANVVIDDTTHASVAYTSRPGTGGLWVGSSNGGSPVAAQYTTGELRAGQTPGVSIRVADAYAVIDAGRQLLGREPQRQHRQRVSQHLSRHDWNAVGRRHDQWRRAERAGRPRIRPCRQPVGGERVGKYDRRIHRRAVGGLWKPGSGRRDQRERAELTGSPKLRRGRQPLGAKPGGEHCRGVQRRGSSAPGGVSPR